MRNVRQAAAVAVAGVLASAPAFVHAQQVHPGETQGLGLRGPDIPDLLKKISADPYRAPAEPACQSIPAELVALNQVLGVDADQPRPKKSMVKKATSAIVGAARGMIPYRGEVRFLTGADRKDHQLMDATQAAWARRGFLRGLEANLHCADGVQLDTANAQPLGPPVDTTVARLDLPPAPPSAPAYATQAQDGLWQLPPPQAADAAAPADDPAAAQPVAAQPVTAQSGDLAVVMLRDERDGDADGGFDRPGR